MGSATRSHGEELRAACRSRTDMPTLGRGRVLSPARWSSRRTRRGRMRGSGADAVRPNRWHWRTRSCSFPWNMSGPLRRAANDVWRSAAKQGNRRTEGPTSPGRSLVACLSLGCAPQAAASDCTVDRQDVNQEARKVETWQTLSLQQKAVARLASEGESQKAP